MDHFFGDWIKKNIEINTIPFKHIVINNFLNNDIFQEISDVFPQKPNEHFWEYKNPLEVKYTFDNV